MKSSANTRSAARLRGVQRRRSAGAAMVEAVVTIPTFLILFASSIFVWQLYLSKIEAQQKARFDLWTYSISDNCNDPGEPGPGDGTAAQANMQNGSVQGVDNSDLTSGGSAGSGTDEGVSTVGGGGQTGILKGQFSGNTYVVSSSVTAAGLLGGFTAPVSAKRTMLCNEPPHNGDLKGLASGALHTLTGWQ